MAGILIIVIILFIIIRRKKKKKEQTRKSSQSGPVTVPVKPQAMDMPFHEGDLNDYLVQGRKLEALQKEYKVVLERHMKLEENIGVLYTVARELHLPNSPEMERVVDLCKEDIKLAKDIIDYYRKWNDISGFDQGDSLRFDTFKRLAIIYEKQGRYDEAIEVCQQAVKLGITKDGTDGGMIGRAARLTRKKFGKAKRIQSASDDHES